MTPLAIDTDRQDRIHVIFPKSASSEVSDSYRSSERSVYISQANDHSVPQNSHVESTKTTTQTDQIFLSRTVDLIKDLGLGSLDKTFGPYGGSAEVTIPLPCIKTKWGIPYPWVCDTTVGAHFYVSAECCLAAQVGTGYPFNLEQAYDSKIGPGVSVSHEATVSTAISRASPNPGPFGDGQAFEFKAGLIAQLVVDAGINLGVVSFDTGGPQTFDLCKAFGFSCNAEYNTNFDAPIEEAPVGEITLTFLGGSIPLPPPVSFITVDLGITPTLTPHADQVKGTPQTSDPHAFVETPGVKVVGAKSNFKDEGGQSKQIFKIGYPPNVVDANVPQTINVQLANIYQDAGITPGFLPTIGVGITGCGLSICHIDKSFDIGLGGGDVKFTLTTDQVLTYKIYRDQLASDLTITSLQVVAMNRLAGAPFDLGVTVQNISPLGGCSTAYTFMSFKVTLNGKTIRHYGPGTLLAGLIFQNTLNGPGANIPDYLCPGESWTTPQGIGLSGSFVIGDNEITVCVNPDQYADQNIPEITYDNNCETTDVFVLGSIPDLIVSEVILNRDCTGQSSLACSPEFTSTYPAQVKDTVLVKAQVTNQGSADSLAISSGFGSFQVYFDGNLISTPPTFNPFSSSAPFALGGGFSWTTDSTLAKIQLTTAATHEVKVCVNPQHEKVLLETTYANNCGSIQLVVKAPYQNPPPGPFDFSLFARPNPVSVFAGATVTTMITVYWGLTNAVSNMVSLTAQCASNSCPFTTSLNPTQGNAKTTPNGVGYESTFTIVTAASSLPGTYNSLITGTGGGKTHTVTVQVSISKAPNTFVSIETDFTIFSLTNTATVRQGASTVVNLGVNLVTGTTQPVTLRVQGLPAYATGTFRTPSSNPPFTSTLVISAGSGRTPTPTGTYSVTIYANGAGKTHTVTIQLTVTT